MARPRLAMMPSRVATIDTSIAQPPAKVREDYYGTPEHKAWAAAVIKRDGGICQDPQHKGPKQGLRCVADHIKERKDRPDLQLDVSNGLTRCWPCHTRKTLAERAKRGRGERVGDSKSLSP